MTGLEILVVFLAILSAIVSLLGVSALWAVQSRRAKAVADFEKKKRAMFSATENEGDS